ncbi:PREDICTED: putative disease resistance protein At1g50180 [Ipomoea nil]|uniref:putative disease resistance protein At1g50180 n=1 Tax=Ipomoea nil TaxID=35883 RepID=UPI0009016C4B|nr:PREDICTED: putative disease resistance protein At1g50180 [Ipomoea nil]
MARLMSTRGDAPSKWRNALKSLDYYSQEFESEAGGSLASLNRALLSYYELPTYLKSCFLYCEMFPKTYGIFAQRLIRMCIAEGFIIKDDPHSGSDRTLEHIARDYFLQLKNRSLLQIIPDEYNGKEWGRIEMHDLYRVVACEAIRREMFAEIIKLEQSSCRKLEWKQRFSLIILDEEQKVQLDNCYENMKKLHTLIINHCERIIAVNSFPQMLQNMKLLRVFVLEWLPDGMVELPNEVGDLIHLSYLSLSGHNVTHLPDSLGRLHNLQTLDLKSTLINSLPKCVSELMQLRHLFGGDELQVSDIVFTFSQLQTLSGILINTIQARD